MGEDEIWRRYAGEQLPRYTSYPTAPHFHAGVSTDDYAAWLAALDGRERISLYLHIPFCRAMCWYCGCHTTITQRAEPIERYLHALHCELDAVAARTTMPLPVGHVHFGGGTPTIIGPQHFGKVMQALRRRFALDAASEIAIEADPRTLTREMAQALGDEGVTRASIGVQTCDLAVQQAINRIQPIETTAAAVTMLRDAGIRSINFDLIYGLPGQTLRSCEETVAECLTLAPERFAVFGYAHVPSFKKHQRAIDTAQLPDAQTRHQQAEAIAAALVAAGYRRIGFDHFARADDAMARAQAKGELHRNFQGYTTDACPTLIGLGASAIGRLPQGYVQNEVALDVYCERAGRVGLATAKGYRLTADDRLRAELIERLMCDLAVDIRAVCARHGTSPAAVSAALPKLQALAADGIVEFDGHTVRVPERYRLLARIAAASFDAHLADPARGYSRAV